jgi:hypothetical protein
MHKRLAVSTVFFVLAQVLYLCYDMSADPARPVFVAGLHKPVGVTPKVV